MAKEKEVHTDALGKGKSIPLGDVGNPGPIEQVSENDFVKEADLAEFMNELVTIYVAPDSARDALPTVIPSVNGINQPIIRGKNIKIKRKYVEALARCRFTRYEQKVRDSSAPHQIDMEERTAVLNPFSVIHDPSGERGFAWLQSILDAA